MLLVIKIDVPPENITITTPELKNYVEVNPNCILASNFDIFLNNATQSAANLPSQITFRNASSSIYQNKL